MDIPLLDAKFTRIGARLKAADRPARGSRMTGPVSLDVGTDRRGEFFAVAGRPGAAVEVLDVQPADRHLLLLVREGRDKLKFLCGHDERHWFVAAVPETAAVGTVRQAKEALKPAAVQAAQAGKGLRAAARARRKNAAYVRQGEWFFLPAPDFHADERRVLRDEPLSRGAGSKPHRLEFCYRSGGEPVYVCRFRPDVLTEARYRALLARNPEAKNWGWAVMRRDAGVYARGRVRHADHRTIMLHGWHRVLMNREAEAKAMRHVAFLD